jgi:hypothetical protein
LNKFLFGSTTTTIKLVAFNNLIMKKQLKFKKNNKKSILVRNETPGFNWKGTVF